MTKQWNVGVVGCGHIFDAYARLSQVFSPIRIIACADIDMATAQRRAATYGFEALSFDAMLARPDIEAIINLTNPASHAEVTGAILAAGKHAYSEKPLALSLDDANGLLAAAEKAGRLLACAPDTFLGGAHQLARRLIDEGRVGEIKSGSAHFMNHGMENWHPNPHPYYQVGAGRLLACAPDTFLGGAHQLARRLIDEGRVGEIKSGSAHFMNHGMENWHPNPHPYYQVGAGPVLDMGPYYISALVNLLGPVKRVVALASKFFEERTVTAAGPNQNTVVPVTTPTTSQALLEFASGAQIHFSVSYDNWGHGHANPIELHGTRASLMVPDPNYFGGAVELIDRNGREKLDANDTVFGHLNWVEPAGKTIGNYRGLGLADLLDAAETGRQPRASGGFARHVLEVLLGIIRSAEEHRFVDIASTIARPAPLTEADAALLKSATAPASFAA